jgi:hypothetical protein
MMAASKATFMHLFHTAVTSNRLMKNWVPWSHALVVYDLRLKLVGVKNMCHICNQYGTHIIE